LVALLSMWQPIGVTVASGIAYGTAAKWRCDPDLPSCRAVGAGEACCTASSNMGWRYNVIVLGAMTLLVFFLRYFVFRFHESPKFLLSRGKEAEAIEVLHKIARFNNAPPPTLTVEMFALIDRSELTSLNSTSIARDVPHPGTASRIHVLRGFTKELHRLKGIFTSKLSAFTFFLLAIAYMVSLPVRGFHMAVLTKYRVTIGLSTLQEPSYPLSSCATTSTQVGAR